MSPTVNRIDHVHVYVADWAESESWYQRVLGFSRDEGLAVWAVDGGPLTLKNDDGTVHLALFESADPRPASTVAFGATGDEFLAWLEHLKAQAVDVRLADHSLAWSMYFVDPDGNCHEITTYDHAVVARSNPS
ncbi:VOC family protein [Pseudohalioglobus lutimaris]|uniref:VOC domain-containing protein n=1 Tax=Pseudohalioglobus lutimaris TaxID=1737061 RepID=A0A2N5X831_9GAMM|nr:VOC family protein [Pseudohalioglobus lutimaris]PLW70650.1 hypothetical protein C0039_00515 [Pseudohalioglobus lutimaris]